jgi:YaiO family outer membrane protein
MTALLVLLVLAQTPSESVEPRVGLQLEQGFERYEGDDRLFLNTRLGADLKASERVWLRADVCRVDKFGKTGWGTGLLADIRVGNSLRLLPGVSLGDPDVLAVSSAGVGAMYSGLEWWPGFVLTGWLTLYSFADSRSVATSVGAVQYYKWFWFQYTFRYAQGLNIEVPGLSHALSVGARFDMPVRFELSVSGGAGDDAYLAGYLEQPSRVELRGVSGDVRTRLWVLRNAGVLATAWMGNQWWKSGEPAFLRRGVGVGLWTEL